MKYTERETVKLIELYEENPCLETVTKLANLFNKPKKSIISKLVKEGVYQKKGYLTKRGEKPITKLQLVRQLEEMLDTTLPDLDKAPKSTLQNLVNHLNELNNLISQSKSDLLDLKAEIENFAAFQRSTKADELAQRVAERDEWVKYLD